MLLRRFDERNRSTSLRLEKVRKENARNTREVETNDSVFSVRNVIIPVIGWKWKYVEVKA